MTGSGLSPLGPVKLAVTVDDLFQWVGTPESAAHGARSIARRMTDAYRAHGIRGVYAFSNTAPTTGPLLHEVFDRWTAAGHHVGNHTHSHVSLNWLTPERYVADIEKTEALIGRWSERAPKRFFRHCFDMWGDSAEKQAAVAAYLARAGYAVAPISVWFYDAQFAFAYLRALSSGDADSIGWVRNAFVETAVKQLRVQAAAARLIFGRDPVHIWLIHGTAVTADCMPEILDRFAGLGVEFVSLEEAMADPLNGTPPIVTRFFRNQVQKWAELKGVPIEDCPPAILAELDRVCPDSGVSDERIYTAFLQSIAAETGAVPELADLAVS